MIMKKKSILKRPKCITEEDKSRALQWELLNEGYGLYINDILVLIAYIIKYNEEDSI